MRPIGLAGPEAVSTTPRKPSFVNPPPSPPRNNAPTSFFLARESDLSSRAEASPVQDESHPPVICTLDEAIGQADTSTQDGTDSIHAQRRRSTIRPRDASSVRSRSTQSRNQPFTSEPTTPPIIASPGEVSLPSSPKSISIRSLQHAESVSLSDDGTSQAMLSSEDDDQEPSAEIQDSAPQLIMPSIRMPSRRPFTSRGRELGRLKIMVAGSKGSGKTALIKSIVQSCEDIVHVDPLGSTANSPTDSLSLDRQVILGRNRVTEIFASTKPYPSWWSDFDDSRILRRRKSLGDAVLERNICFVDTAPAMTGEHLAHYLEHQLQAAMMSTSTGSGHFFNMLSGVGGPQVDVVLYLVLKETLAQDIEAIQQLSALSNVVPLLAMSDKLSTDQITQLKQEIAESLSCRLLRPFSFPILDNDETTESQPPFAVSAANSPDNENMDASLLMSPDYIQPLAPSELSILVKKIFNKETLSYFRHSTAKKLLLWRSKHPQPIDIPQTTPSASPRPSSLSSPVLTSMSTSGVLIPYASDMSLNTSNSYTLARVADHTQREERYAQVRLTRWATDLQQSLNREREKYERIARGERAMWLVERMGQEVRDGRLQAFEVSRAGDLGRRHITGLPTFEHNAFATNDPLGLLKWNDDMRTRGWIALQVVGSFGVIGGLAIWLARAWGLGSSMLTEHTSGEFWKW